MAGRKPQGRGDKGLRDDEGGFLSRWSERKREASERQRPDPSADPGKVANARDAEARGAGENNPTEPQAEDFDPKDLPDIETLGRDSDFSVFMHEKVPDALRRRALRRLWRVDPVFAHLDGMNDYDEDYTDAALVVEGLKTAYQVGKGMLVEEPDEAEADGAEQLAAEEGQDEALGGEAAGDDASAAASADEAAPAKPADPLARDDELLKSAAAKPEEGLPLGPEQQVRAAPLQDEAAGGDSREKLRGAAVRRRWGDGSG